MHKFSFFIKQLLTTLICVFSWLSIASSAPLYTHHQFIHYTDIGHGKPLVLIHAFPSDERLWVPQQVGLQPYFRVITLDLWGFGSSSPVDGRAVTMSDYADELHQLLQQLHIDTAVIAGESMGGYIALAFLANYPDEVEGLVLGDTQALADSPETRVVREKTAVDVLEHGTDVFINTFMTKALSPYADEQTQSFLRNILISQSPSAIASALRGMALRDDATELLRRTTKPVLIITGSDDVVISPTQSVYMHQLNQHSRLITLEHAGHLANLEQSEQWNQAVIDMFLN